MLDIEVKTTPHHQQRYPTCGDWQQPADGVMRVTISDMQNWRMEFCVAVHELIEAALCQHNEVDAMAVDVFDMQYEKERSEGDVSEPGDDPAAPYHREHCFATGIERLLVAELGLNWQVYENVINSL